MERVRASGRDGPCGGTASWAARTGAASVDSRGTVRERRDDLDRRASTIVLEYPSQTEISETLTEISETTVLKVATESRDPSAGASEHADQGKSAQVFNTT